MANGITRVARVRGIYSAGISPSVYCRVSVYGCATASPMGKDKNVACRGRKGHPTPPTYAMQSRQQFCILGVTDMAMKPTCRGAPAGYPGGV